MYTPNQMRLIEIVNFQLFKLLKGFDTPVSPLMDPETIDRLTTELARAKFYLEFGSGGSTILADKMGVETLSVEGDPVYAKAVRKGLTGNTVRLITPRIGPTGVWGYPLLNHPRWLSQRLRRRYVAAPFREKRFPDLILVDGRFRVACALESARQANLRGVTANLIIDDYEGRPHYHVVEEFLGRPEMVGRAALFQIGTQSIPPLDFIDSK